MNRNISMRFQHISCANPLIEIVDKETERLQKHHPRIRGFSIIVEKTHRKHKKGNPVRAQVIISLPNKRIVVSKEVDGMTEGDNAAIALRHMFDVSECAVDQYIKKSRFRAQELNSAESQATEIFDAPPA